LNKEKGDQVRICCPFLNFKKKTFQLLRQKTKYFFGSFV